MKYKVKTHPNTTHFTGTDIYAALDFASEYSDKNPNINLWVYNEKEEEICLIVNGVYYMECDYKEARQYAEEMEGGAQ